MRSALRSFAFLASLAAPLAAADPGPAQSWTVRPSLAARIGYDDNLFLQDHAPATVGFLNPVPEHAGALFIRTSALIEATWQLSSAFQIDAAYAPEIVRYDDYASENHDDHRLDLGVSGREGAWSYQFKSSATLVDGDDTGPVFGNTHGGPAIGGVGVRSRRDQLNTRATGQLTHTSDAGFVRVAADTCINDYDTRLISTTLRPGYANYVDRSEWSAGVDLGRKLRKNFAAFVGVRGGAQHQDDLVGKTTNYSNNLVRVLVGLEGRPSDKLTLRVAAGPDFRHYDDSVAPTFDRSRATRYVEASATWTPTSADTLGLCVKDYLWLSASGPCAYQHTLAGVTWKHAFNSRWTANASADVQAGDSRDYAPPGAGRLDWIYTGSLGLTYALDARTKIDAEVVREWSDCTFSPATGREYTRWQYSLGVKRSF